MATSPLTFDTVNKIEDPLLGFKWVCTLMPSVNGVNLPKEYAESVDIPFPEIQRNAGIFAGGTYTYFPGYEDFGAFNLKLYEDKKARSLHYLTKWREAIRQPSTGLYYLESNYKREMHFSLYDQENEEVVVLKLYGCWPTALGQLPLTQESERISLQQNYSCDGLEIEFKRI